MLTIWIERSTGRYGEWPGGVDTHLLMAMAMMTGSQPE